ncbi:MAG: hypothetical protein F6K50_52810, partial [Moorea sp. SIO3I7]|nr:hypothetical protein [Moorena sp. SIO3I7]
MIKLPRHWQPHHAEANFHSFGARSLGEVRAVPCRTAFNETTCQLSALSRQDGDEKASRF